MENRIVDIQSPQALEGLVPFIKDAGYVSFDLETESLRFQDRILSLQMTVDNVTYYLPFTTIPELREEKPFKKPKPKKGKKQEQEAPKVIQEALFDMGAISLDFHKIEQEVAAEVEEKKPLFDNFENFEDYSAVFVDFDECRAGLKAIFSDPDIRKYAHNMKFDAQFLIYRGIDVLNWYFDPMLAAWQLKEDRMSYELKVLIKEFYDIDTPTFKQLVGDRNYWELSDEQMIKYACDDTVYTMMLADKFKPLIVADTAPFSVNTGWQFFKEQMMGVAEVLCHMEMNGVLIDYTYAVSKVAEYDAVLAEAQGKIETLIKKTGYDGPDISITSTQQLATLFYDHLGYTAKSKKKRAMDKHVLKQWADKGSDLAASLMQFRKTTSLRKFIAPDQPGSILSNVYEDGRLYPNFNQHRTDIHRLSSSRPNSQNLPREGGSVRECFIPSPGHVFYIIDYSQIELRCAAFYSRDAGFMSAYASDDPVDIHGLTRANIIAPVFPELNSTEQRTLAKNFNFGILYGAGPKGISDLLGIPESKSELLIIEFRSYYHGHVEWTDKVHRFVNQHRWVGNRYGGRRRFGDTPFNELPRWKKSFFEREAVHFIVSSTASCILKDRMLKIHAAQQRKEHDLHFAKMLLQIHDELIFEVPEGFDPQPIKTIMESEDGIFDIPIVADGEFKDRWTK